MYFGHTRPYTHWSPGLKISLCFFGATESFQSCHLLNSFAFKFNFYISVHCLNTLCNSVIRYKFRVILLLLLWRMIEDCLNEWLHGGHSWSSWSLLSKSWIEQIPSKSEGASSFWFASLPVYSNNMHKVAPKQQFKHWFLSFKTFSTL